jgi:hypothetical protein
MVYTSRTKQSGVLQEINYVEYSRPLKRLVMGDGSNHNDISKDWLLICNPYYIRSTKV